MQADPRELLRLAIASAQEQDLGAAAGHLEALLAVEERHEIANGMLGAIYAQLKEPGLAAHYFERALEIDPGNPLARFQLGLLLLQNGEPERALDTLRPALDDPQDFLAHFHSALALMQLSRPQQARPLLDIVSARMPRDHVLYPSLQDLLSTF